MAFLSGLSWLLGVHEEVVRGDVQFVVDQVFDPLISICSAVAPLFTSSSSETLPPSAFPEVPAPCAWVDVPALPQVDSEEFLSDADVQSFLADTAADSDVQRSAHPLVVQHALCGQPAPSCAPLLCDGISALPQANSEDLVLDADVQSFFADSDAQRSAHPQVVQHALCGQSSGFHEGGEQRQQQDSDALDFSPSGADLARSPEKSEALASICQHGLCLRKEGAPQVKTKEILKGGLQEIDDSLASRAGSRQLDWGCLTEIMSYLDNKSLQSCSLVCREWSDASSFVRSSMTVQEGPQVAALPRLLMRFSRLQVLHIKASSDPSASFCLDDTSMELIARCCRGLAELTVEACLGFSDQGLALVLRSCSQLRRLDVIDCCEITGESFKELNCGLETLQLASEGVTNQGLVAAVTACPQLKDFALVRRTDAPSLNEGLRSIAKLCGGLTRLKIHGGCMTDDTLSCFATSCPLLREMTISCHDTLSDEGLQRFFARQRQLETMTLYNLLPFERVPQFGPHLRSLNLGCCWGAENSALEQISKMKTLEELSLFMCPHLFDEGMEKILAGCTNLKKVTLEANEELTVRTARAFASSDSKATLIVRRCSELRSEHLTDELLCFDRLRVSEA